MFSPENVNGMNTYETFKTSVGTSFSPDLQNLIWSQNKQYDIIYVDWNNGIDYMQRNAYALEEVIKWVNSVKVGTEKNVVLGQSMGGVIARYALADMEQTSIDHKTRLFISHDAPQQGANIPVSIQFMYRHLTNQYIQTNTTLFGGIVTVPVLENKLGVSNYLSVLDAPASRQLLSNFSNLSYGIDNSVHTTFFNELKAKGVANSGGYPVNCRNIAISNGAECGMGQGFNPSDNLLNYNWNKGLTFGGDLLSMVYLPLGGSIGGLFLDNDFFGVEIAGLIPGKSKYRVEFNAKAMPYGTNNQIYKGRISYSKRILWIGPTIVVNITNVQKNQPAGILPLDTYGGGFYNTSIVVGSVSDPNLYIRDKFNFIPTTSALDIGKRNITLQDADYKKAYVGATPPVAPTNSPFANFSTDFEKYNPNSSNKPHISFNSRNGEWLSRELNVNAITTNCSYMCASNQITGPNTVCSSATYSAPSGATYYDWTITEGANLVNLAGNFTNTITLSPTNSNSAGQVTLSLFFGSGDCGDIILTKTIWVGKPSIEINLTSNSNYVTIDLVGAEGTDINQQGITATTWTQTASTNGGSAGGSGFSGFGNGPNFYWTATLVITATNACGTTSITRDVTCAPPAPCDTSYNLVAKSTSGYTVNKIIEPCAKTANQKTVAASANEIVSAKLYDMSNIEIRNYRTNDYSVEGVKKGIYILKVQVKDIMLTKKIIVN